MEEILKIINENAVTTGNLCGISLVQITARITLPMDEVRKILNKLCADNKAKAREGIHGKLLFAVKPFTL